VQDRSNSPNVENLKKIANQHQIIFSIKNSSMAEEILNNGALKVSLNEEDFNTEVLGSLPKERILVEFTLSSASALGPFHSLPSSFFLFPFSRLIF